MLGLIVDSIFVKPIIRVKVLVHVRELIFGLLMRQTDQKQGGGRLFQYKQYLTYYIDFFNIIQPAWGTEWIIAGDESHNTDFTGENVC